MAEIINLRRARKEKARADKAAEAAQNRITYGTPKALREKARADERRAEQHLDQHKRDD